MSNQQCGNQFYTYFLNYIPKIDIHKEKVINTDFKKQIVNISASSSLRFLRELHQSYVNNDGFYGKSFKKSYSTMDFYNMYNEWTIHCKENVQKHHIFDTEINNYIEKRLRINKKRDTFYFINTIKLNKMNL